MKAQVPLLLLTAFLLTACGDGTVEVNPATTTEATAGATTWTAVETTASTASAAPTTRPETSSTAMAMASNDFKALIAAVQTAGEPTSSRMEGSQRVIGLSTTEVANGEVTIPFSAAHDNETGNSSFAVDMTAAATITPAEDDGMADMEDLVGAVELREVDDRLYIKFGFLTMMYGAQTDWISIPRELGAEFGEDLIEGAVPDPIKLLEAYQDADTHVEEIGREEVNRVETTHFVIDIDTRSLLGQMSDEEWAELEANVPVHTGAFSMDLWLSDEGHLVRMVMDVDGSMVEEVEPGATFERMIYTFDVFDIGRPITIEEPPASEVTPVEALTGVFEIEIEID